MSQSRIVSLLRNQLNQTLRFVTSSNVNTSLIIEEINSHCNQNFKLLNGNCTNRVTNTILECYLTDQNGIFETCENHSWDFSCVKDVFINFFKTNCNINSEQDSLFSPLFIFTLSIIGISLIGAGGIFFCKQKNISGSKNNSSELKEQNKTDLKLNL